MHPYLYKYIYTYIFKTGVYVQIFKIFIQQNKLKTVHIESDLKIQQ